MIDVLLGAVIPHHNCRPTHAGILQSVLILFVSYLHSIPKMVNFTLWTESTVSTCMVQNV